MTSVLIVRRESANLDVKNILSLLQHLDAMEYNRTESFALHYLVPLKILWNERSSFREKVISNYFNQNCVLPILNRLNCEQCSSICLRLHIETFQFGSVIGACSFKGESISCLVDLVSIGIWERVVSAMCGEPRREMTAAAVFFHWKGRID